MTETEEQALYGFWQTRPKHDIINRSITASDVYRPLHTFPTLVFDSAALANIQAGFAKTASNDLTFSPKHSVETQEVVVQNLETTLQLLKKLVYTTKPDPLGASLKDALTRGLHTQGVQGEIPIFRPPATLPPAIQAAAAAGGQPQTSQKQPTIRNLPFYQNLARARGIPWQGVKKADLIKHIKSKSKPVPV